MNVNALLQVADSYYYGRGVAMNWGYAAQLYEKASDRSSQALFNLGFMHQYGAGLEQDLHLAKRYIYAMPVSIPSLAFSLFHVAKSETCAVCCQVFRLGKGTGFRGRPARPARSMGPARSQLASVDTSQSANPVVKVHC